MHTLTEPPSASPTEAIDLDLQRLERAPAAVGAAPWHVRLGLSWSSGSPPLVLLLVIGAALGPHALNVLTPGVLSALDPALPVALAALGVHIALSLPFRPSRHDARVLAGASLEASITGLVVAGGILLLAMSRITPMPADAWMLAIAAGICASMSAGLVSDTSGVAASAAGVRQLDVLLPAAAGGLLLAWVREGSLGAGLLLILQASVLAAVVAAAVWLLLARTASETEARIFGFAALLLVGGLADYLSLSALLGGLIAGAFWRIAGGPAAGAIRRDLDTLRHPLVVLMLVVAGARTELGPTAWALAFTYPALRTAGKLGGAWIARRAGLPLPADIGRALVPAGVFGVAFALNIERAAGSAADPLLGVVVAGTILSQIVVARHPQELRE
jgi:hypothetical protein